MSGDWQPLSARESGKAASLREEVSDGLVQPLRSWIERTAYYLPKEVIERLGVLLDIDLTDFWFQGSPHERLANAPLSNRLLDVTDAVLHSMATFAPSYAGMARRLNADNKKREVRESLQQLLDDAQSTYEVKEDCTGLQRRINPVAAELRDMAIKSAQTKSDVGSAVFQLREASDAVRAMHPDTKKAYRMAVTAVESAAHAVIEPNNKNSTLGTMLRIVEANPVAFEVEIASKDRGKGPITPITGMMRMLWDGQTSRHGSKQPTREETREEAEMAVQLASVLVLWFSTGMVRRK
jgi:hypothetical protein